ncbi:hypothetical protein LXA43DRAFT_1006622 [Ganoderma leucocontextum]|nr:hypothetical protein LXA43DRAFT_1006622 [Ganoderma leucocontextum]
MDASDVGRLGALQLLRYQSPESVVTSYPIDDEEITIGRDQSCSLRLYYPAVSALHAKITFVERKAFLVILGTNGVLLDDEPIFPAPANASGPTTVPLQNNSVIELHKKRFRFMYPPKHLRSAVINTPTQGTPGVARRPLRLSMIASAHVFTPRPSHDPQENLRILQTPLRTPFSLEQEEIVLVHSNAPRVVEEEKDLVILDEVEPEPVLPLPLPLMAQYPVTPVRRPPRPSLHRAVLIRSAQRVALQREVQREEEEQDAEEVEDVIDAIAEESDEDVQEIPHPDGQQQVSGWRKSLDMVKGGLGWAFRGLSVEPKEEEQEPALDEEIVQEDQEEQDEEMDEEGIYEQDEEYDQENHYEYEYQDERDDTPLAEPPRPLGQFMTPQIQRFSKQPRLSLGPGAAPDVGPRRVRVVAPWKVSEIQVPATVKEEGVSGPSTSAAAPPSTPLSPVKREKLTDEEREAIRARRRSALATPDNFFKGQTPGSRRTLFPTLAPLPSPSFGEAASSSTKAASAQETSTSTSSSTSSVKVEEQEDTAVLLARMKQMVEGVKQRQSLGRQSLSLSPRKREGGFSLLAPDHARPHRPSHILLEEEDGDAHMDDEPEHEHEEVEEPALASAPKTPRMSDLRHVFQRPREELSTPALAGVREMFRPHPQGPAETPRMDGMQEMLSTPVAYRAAPAAETQDEGENEEEEEEEEPVAELPAKTARGKRTPATKIARKPPVPQSAPSKSTRASSQVPDEPQTTGTAARRTRARTADGAVGQTLRATRGKPAAKAMTPEPKEDEDKPEPQPVRATRRTRTTTDSSTTSTANTDDADTKPARRTRAKTPTPVANTSTTKAGASTTRRGTRAKPIEVVEEEEDRDDDPLDSLPREPASSNAKSRRGARSKAAVKQEDADDAVPPVPPLPAAENDAPRATRARRTPVPRATPVPDAARTRGASGAATEAVIPEGKENTPEPDEDKEEGKTTTTTKRKGTRTTAARAAGKNAAASASGEGVAPAATAATKTRAGRTRAAKA